jgi:PIN domain nuclease of toxin-antitoxin system
MRYLLDTHTLLWIAYNNQKLSRETVKILENKTHEFYISVVSIWEINIKFAAGKLYLNKKTPIDLFKGFDTYFECTYLNLNSEDTISFHKLTAFHHKDPFDRMMIWQAIQHQLIFITDDANIHKYQDCGLKVIW